MQSTLYIFHHLYNNLPPLLPEDIGKKMGEALETLEKNSRTNLDEIEKTMVKFGYEIWPYNQAFKEFIHATEIEVGEHFLLPRLSSSLQKKYEDFKRKGGTFEEFHVGRAAEFFTPEERVQLCEALVEMEASLRLFVRRQITSIDEKKYHEKVKKSQEILDEVRENLERLRQVAEREKEDCPVLAQEIAAKVKSFEHGLCLLGPELDFEAVCQAEEYFVDRKKKLKNMGNFHLFSQVQF